MGKPKAGRIKQSITIEKETWVKAGKILEEVGISRSRYIEITLRHLYKGQEQTFQNVTNELFKDLFDSSSKIAEKRKKMKKT